jgi:hypothetical protein
MVLVDLAVVLVVAIMVLQVPGIPRTAHLQYNTNTHRPARPYRTSNPRVPPGQGVGYGSYILVAIFRVSAGLVTVLVSMVYRHHSLSCPV